MTSTLLIKLTLLAAIISIAYSVGIYEQCAGEDYGTFPCDAGLTCFRRNKWYSSCQSSCPRNVGWECEDVALVILAAYSQCNNVSNAICSTGTGCFRNNANYSECRPDCPATWACETDVAGPNEQCGGMIYQKQRKLQKYE